MSIKIYPAFYLILFLFLQQKIKSEEIEDNKYSFQLYNSHDIEEIYYFYAQTYKNLITINSTEGENNTIIETKTTNEYLYKGISSVSLIDDTFLIKTCFGPDNLIQVLYKNKGTYFKKINNFDKIKFCYSTKIKNPYIRPINPDEYVIITYWTEIESITNRESYSHKCIFFYPSSNTFSEEFILSSESKFINLYYPEKCTTFRNEDIFCGIHFSSVDDSLHILGNNYIIETNKIVLPYGDNFEPSIYVVIDKSVISSSNYHIPISLGKNNPIPKNGGYGDIYMSEFHNYNKNGNGKTLLLYSYYIKKLKNEFKRTNYIPFFEDTKLFYGLNVQDKYIHQNLFNHLIHNKDELIIIYISKENKTNLYLLIFDINDSKSQLINNNFKGIANYYYQRNDICNEPKYLQSLYINSFINYDNNDKNIIKNNPNKKYYTYQKNIGIMISCSEDNDNIVYESKKIEMPQCLNILDEINGNNKHILKYDEEQKEIIFDLYGDPNLFSLRNVKITFYNSALFSFLILMQVKIEGETTFKNITYDIDYKTVTHIKFIKKYNFPIKEPLILPYRLKQNKINKNSIASELVSDICKLEFSIDNNHGQVCELDFCIICQSKTICESCNTDINGLIKDNNKNSETYGKCICDEDKGFKKMPDKENNMCVCKDNYSFYLNTSQCIQNLELNHNPFYFIDNEFNTNISIYGDCYQTCKKCSKEGSKEEHNCDECKDGYIMFGNFCINPNIDISSYSIKETDNSDTSLNSIHESPIYKKVNDNNVCLYENKEWFKLGKHIFYYAKIDKCIFIYYGIELFFISNKIQ